MKTIWRRPVLFLGLGVLVMVAGFLIVYEMRTSALQAQYFSMLSRRLTHHVASGPSSTILFPSAGPYDTRLGYTRLPEFLERLTTHGYTIARQARMSPFLQQTVRWGLFPVYDEKTQAGLRIRGRRDEWVYATLRPARIYPRFEDIPKVIVETLLFIENRELLNPNYPQRNPVVEWDRLGRAAWLAMARIVTPNQHAVGGSTLATQLEKFRHSPGGRTDNALEKLRQMLTASLRAYRFGANTLNAQRRIVLDYLNSLPLAAQDAYGEVHGLGDGLWTWYGSDFDQVNEALSKPFDDSDPEQLSSYAAAYKRVLSLFLAHRRPSLYLRDDPVALSQQTNRYLHLTASAGLISPALRDAALRLPPLPVRRRAPAPPAFSFVDRKAANIVRSHLAAMLNVPEFYALDRLDLEVQSSLDHRVQDAVAARLQDWSSLETLQTDGMIGRRLLRNSDDPNKVRYSLALYERAGSVNLLRVHTDNLNQPFDLNQGLKLDLGSTAKLRTLITYLEIVASLHERYAAMSPTALRAVDAHPEDRLTQWALAFLLKTPHSSLLRMLDAAMSRRYSANPNERFFTGGGIHEFVNFDDRDDAKILTVREAVRRSVNLVFIRLMRDVVHYYTAALPEVALETQTDAVAAQAPQQEPSAQGDEPLQPEYVVHALAAKTPETIMEALIARLHPTPQRFAVLYGALHPQATLAEFADFLRLRFPHPNLTEALIASLFTRFVAAEHTWESRGALTALPADELRVAAYAYQHPQAERQTLLSVARHRPSRRRARPALNREARIRREQQAFDAIHRAWRRLGYPFASLVPSYATALGSSADRPGALAELIGIVANDGIRYPVRHIEKLHFAAGTPYETLLTPQDQAQPVLHPAVAAVVKEALYDVVERGTAQRLQGVFKHADGRLMRVGGKTGTGDHQHKTFGKGGAVIASRAVNRAAVLVFMIDDRFFGAFTAYVPGADAQDYTFTSSLATQAMKRLAPALEPLLRKEVGDSQLVRK